MNENGTSACSYLMKPDHQSTERERNASGEENAVMRRVQSESNSVQTLFRLLEFRLKHADDCVAVYQTTIDKKLSDVTNRESDQIKTCKSANLYPPEK
jgi:hypothetical protein